MPGFVHAWPKSAACWSPAMPAIGIGVGGPPNGGRNEGPPNPRKRGRGPPPETNPKPPPAPRAHMSLDEWLLAAEYIMSEGNYNVVLCERGVRTFAQHTRNTLDLASIPAVRRISHLPVVVDPSHGTGKNYMVIPLACAGVAVGADGLIVEVHDQPEKLCPMGHRPSRWSSTIN